MKRTLRGLPMLAVGTAGLAGLTPVKSRLMFAVGDGETGRPRLSEARISEQVVGRIPVGVREPAALCFPLETGLELPNWRI